jgi:hypothetical protein
MNFSRNAVLLGLALLAAASTAQAQLISRTFDVSGVSNSVVTRFTIWINANANTVVIDVDNARPLLNGQNTRVGTVTGFGFNTPFSSALLGASDSAVLYASKWTAINAGHTGLPTTIPVGGPTNTTDDFWREEVPFDLEPAYDNDYGVKAQTPNIGIEYGEKATFVFKFNNTMDITAGNFAGFFNNSAATTNDFDFTVRWQEVGKKSDYGLHGECAEGSDKGGINLLPFSDGELPATPEPSTYGLMGAAALLGLVAHRRHKAKKATKAA